MSRNVTVTFDDGSQHVYNNVPDDTTPDQVTARAQKDFPKLNIKALDGGRGKSPLASAPQLPPTNPGNANVGSEYAMGPFGPGLSATMGVPAATQVGTPQNSSAPYGLRNKLSLEVNPSNQQVVNTINQSVGNGSGALGPQGPQFTAPGAKNPTLVNPPNLPFSNLPTVGGTMDTVLPGIGATVAATGVGAITKNPFAAVSAGATGAAVGQEVSNEGKNLLSKFFNREPMTAHQQIEDLKSAGNTGVNTAVIGSFGFLPSIGNFLNRGPLGLGNVNTLQRVYNSATNARNMLGDFFELVGNTRFSPSVTELAPQYTTLANKFEAAGKAEGVTTKPFGQDYILDLEQGRRRDGTNALIEAHNSITDQYKPNPGYTPTEGAYEASQAIAQDKAIQQNQLKLARDQAFNDAKAQGTPQTRFALGKSIMNALSEVKQAGLDSVNKAWGDLKDKLGIPPDEAYGGDPYTQPLGDMPRIGYTNVTKTKLNNLWNRGMSALRNTQTGTPLAGTSANAIFDSIPDELYIDPKDPTSGLIFSDPTKDYSPNLKWYIDGIKGLRAGIRSSVRPGFNPDTLIQKNVADILRDNVNQWFSREGDPSVLDAWENAEQATHEFHQTFGKGILRQVDDQEAGANTPIFNQFATRVLMRGNTDELSRLADVTSNSPYAQNQMRLGIWSLMHEAVHDARTPSQVASKYQGMLGKLAPAISRFFNPEDLDKLDTFEGLTKKVDQLDQQYKDFNKNWKLSEFGDTPSSVPNITSMLYNKNMPLDRAGKLYSFLAEKNPELLGKVKSDMATFLAKQMSNQTGEGQIPSIEKMASVLDDANSRAKIQLFLGGEYLNNANAIKSAAKVFRGQPDTPVSEKAGSIFQQAVRAVFAPPLSREGRAYTGILMWRHRAAARAIYNALSSPEGLSDFINSAHNRFNNAKTITTLGALRAGSLASQLPTSPTPTTGQQTGP